MLHKAPASGEPSPPIDELPDADVHVWACATQHCREPGLLSDYAALLSDGERDRWRRFVFERDRHTYLVSRALLRTVLSRYVAMPPARFAFGAGPHGKPFLQGEQAWVGRLRFNLSHTDGMAVVAVAADREIGVDVESLGRRPPMEVVQAAFTPAEAADLAACEPAAQAHRFWELWTLKEAYLKATGLGLALPFDAFGFELGAARELVLHLADARAPAGPWWLAQWRLEPGHLAALCMAHEGAAPVNLRVREILPLRSVRDLRVPLVRCSRP